VATGQAGATVVDEEALDWCKRRRASRFAKLKIVAESEVFPPTVVVYKEGGLPEGALKRIRDGLTAAGRSTEGKALLTICRIAAFEPVPKD
jgi:ABC-type phosphate/phosphonate transport system substrate-binding protein